MKKMPVLRLIAISIVCIILLFALMTLFKFKEVNKGEYEGVKVRCGYCENINNYHFKCLGMQDIQITPILNASIVCLGNILNCGLVFDG